jgi:hypothetical protein
MDEAFGIKKDVIKLYARAESGAKAQKMINALSKTEGFVAAMSDKVGQEVLNDALVLSEQILDKIIDEDATKEEVAEFRALKKIIERWQKVWSKHKELIEELNKGGK